MVQTAGMTLKKEDYTVRVPRSQRGGEVVEPLIREQWFVRMQPLAQPALQVLPCPCMLSLLISTVAAAAAAVTAVAVCCSCCSAWCACSPLLRQPCRSGLALVCCPLSLCVLSSLSSHFSSSQEQDADMSQLCLPDNDNAQPCSFYMMHQKMTSRV